MPRQRRGSRIRDPWTRRVAGRLCFAAAAEALGGLYGSTSLERVLGFTPASRAQRRAPNTLAVNKPKRPLPTGGCKKWLHGHVVNDRTLSLIAETRPGVAQKIRAARDGGLVAALTAPVSEPRSVARQLRALSPKMYGNYLGLLALGHCNCDFVSRLAEDLLRRSMNGDGLKVLIPAVGVDRQLADPRPLGAAQCLEKAFAISLENAAAAHPEIAFARGALLDLWKNRAVSDTPATTVTGASGLKCL